MSPSATRIVALPVIRSGTERVLPPPGSLPSEARGQRPLGVTRSAPLLFPGKRLDVAAGLVLLDMGNLRAASRAEGVEPSDIRLMSVECSRLGGVNLSQGVCDLEVPLAVRDAAKAAIDEGLNIYTRLDGLASLRQAIAAKHAAAGLPADPEGEIVVTTGSTGAFFSACLGLLDPGDEVIVFEPFYGYHVNGIRAAGGVARPVPMAPPTWTFSKSDLEAAVTARTKAVVVCSPANPTGKVFTREELGWIADLATAHDLFVITDEIYEHFVYDDRRHVSIATLPGMRARTILISGLSKTFSVTGWRIGYALAARPWAKVIGYFHDVGYVCAPSCLQEAVARGLLALPATYYSSIRPLYERKRELLCAALAAAGLTPHVPAGAYYVLADARSLPGNDSRARAMHLLETTRVAAVPGRSFFADPADGDGLLRFCFAKSDPDLELACARLRAGRAD